MGPREKEAYTSENNLEERKDGRGGVVVLVSHEPKSHGQYVVRQSSRLSLDQLVFTVLWLVVSESFSRSEVSRTSTSFINSSPRPFSSRPNASRYDSSPSSSLPDAFLFACSARVLPSSASTTSPRDRTLINCSLSPGSLRPFVTIRNRAAEVARRMVSSGSERSENNRGMVEGVTVRLISIHPGSERS